MFSFFIVLQFDILVLLTDFQMEPDKLTMHVLTTSRPATKSKFWPQDKKSAGRSPLRQFLTPLATAAMWPWIKLIYFDAKIIFQMRIDAPYNK